MARGRYGRSRSRSRRRSRTKRKNIYVSRLGTRL